MPPFYLTGPTGSGKSALALELADILQAEIVNGDAFQLYAGLRVLTARPSEEDERRVPHHLYGFVPTAEAIDANRYADWVRALLPKLQDKRVLIVGGSGLYLKALTHGMNEIPPADPALRRELEAEEEPALRERLKSLDPESEASIPAGNLRYLRRALEITLTCGRPASAVRQSWKVDAPDLRGILLDRPREELFSRINQRVEEMFAQNAVEEVQKIPAWSETSAKTIGVREIQALLNGEISQKECISQIQQASRHYAKRQLTWFRREKWLTIWPIDQNTPVQEAARRIAERFWGENA